MISIRRRIISSRIRPNATRHRHGTRQQEKKQQSPQNRRKQCIHCGGTNHDKIECVYKSATCQVCQQHGHIALGCAQRRTTQAKTNPHRPPLSRQSKQNQRKSVHHNKSKNKLDIAIGKRVWVCDATNRNATVWIAGGVRQVLFKHNCIVQLDGTGKLTEPGNRCGENVTTTTTTNNEDEDIDFGQRERELERSASAQRSPNASPKTTPTLLNVGESRNSPIHHQFAQPVVRRHRADRTTVTRSQRLCNKTTSGPGQGCTRTRRQPVDLTE